MKGLLLFWGIAPRNQVGFLQVKLCPTSYGKKRPVGRLELRALLTSKMQLGCLVAVSFCEDAVVGAVEDGRLAGRKCPEPGCETRNG